VSRAPRSLVATVVLVLILAGPLTANAQPGPQSYRVAFLALASEPPSVAAFTDGLRELGYVEGKNLYLSIRSADGRPERLPQLARELIALKPDVLMVASTASTLAAKRATTSIPIVFVSVIDPVGAGIVPSLARPGGNISGVTGWIGGAGFAGKWVELLKEAVPHVSHVVALSNSANPQSRPQVQDVQAAARALKMKLDVVDAGNAAGLDKALAAIAASGARGMVVTGDPFFAVTRARITEFAASKRLPAVYYNKRFAESGGLMAYGARTEDSYRRAAAYVDKILRGAKPADLPVEQPTTFELVLNLKTANALGLTIPQTLLVRANDIIQ
jgi:putative tryptophan/tyrosine transport system substrate-binding protein